MKLTGILFSLIAATSLSFAAAEYTPLHCGSCGPEKEKCEKECKEKDCDDKKDCSKKKDCEEKKECGCTEKCDKAEKKEA